MKYIQIREILLVLTGIAGLSGMITVVSHVSFLLVPIHFTVLVLYEDQWDNTDFVFDYHHCTSVFFMASISAILYTFFTIIVTVVLPFLVKTIADKITNRTNQAIETATTFVANVVDVANVANITDELPGVLLSQHMPVPTIETRDNGSLNSITNYFPMHISSGMNYMSDQLDEPLSDRQRLISALGQQSDAIDHIHPSPIRRISDSMSNLFDVHRFFAPIPRVAPQSTRQYIELDSDDSNDSDGSNTLFIQTAPDWFAKKKKKPPLPVHLDPAHVHNSARLFGSNTCPICIGNFHLIELNTKALASIAPCNHLFCYTCLHKYIRDKWYMKHNDDFPSDEINCPLCRAPITALHVTRTTEQPVYT